MIRRAGVRIRMGLASALVAVAALLPYPGALGAQLFAARIEEAPEPRESIAREFEEILLDFRIGRLASTTLRAYWDGETALLPVAGVLAAAEIEYHRTPDGGLDATVHPAGVELRVRPDSAEVSRDGRSVDAPADWMVRAEDGDVYLATPALEALLEVDIETDWAELTATVRDPGELPVARRLAREARWNALRERNAAGASVPRIDLAAPAIGGAVLDWGFSSDAEDPRNSASYSIGMAGRVMGGSLRVSSRSLGAAAQGNHRVDATYETVFQDRGWISQLRLGDGFTTGPRLRDVRGFAVTNAPYLRDGLFGSDAFAGRVGPGWEVELRQAGQTVDLTRADEQGAFALDIPVRYGENAVQVVAFGPHGEVVTSERLLVLDPERLPAGRFEWGLSGGECRNPRCRTTGNLDLRYGLSRRWTLRAGAEGFTRDSLAPVLQPYLGISGSIVPSMQVSLEGVRAGFARAGVRFAPSPALRFRVAHTAFSTHLDAPVLHDARRRSTTESDILFRPDPTRARLFARASVLNQSMADGDLLRVQGSVMLPYRNLGLETGVRREVARTASGPRMTRDFQFAAVSGMVVLPGRHIVTLRGELEMEGGNGLERTRAQVGYQLTPGMRLEVGAGWQRFAGSSLTLSLSTNLSQLRNVTQVVAREGAPGRVTQYSQGTVHWDEGTSRVRLSPGPGIERGGISGFVFLDENGNGALDPGEEGVEGVRVVVGNRAVRSDGLGRHAAWDLVPFEPVQVWADSASIADPSLVPLRDRVEVLVPPSSFGRVNIPVSPSRELIGRVVLVTGGESVMLPYARLELMDMASGAVRSLRTYSDGEFYEAGIRPGTYELRLAPDYLRATGLLPLAGWVEVAVPGGTDTAPVGPVVLRVIAAEDLDLEGQSPGGVSGAGG